MGLLDDAIREHLDLKRRRGGDPTEIERAEREALGPVRRVAEPPAEDLPLDDEGTALYDDAAPVSATADAPVFEAPFEDDDLYAEDDDGWLEDEEHPPLTFESPPGEPPVAAGAPAPVVEPEPAPAVPPPAPEPAPVDTPVSGVGDETIEYRVEDALASEEQATGESDVLEQPPGFLEDTPDHDRLWFEQRPPRDFDFDG